MNANERKTSHLTYALVSQILNEDVLKNTCEDSQLCIIAVLPHILDTGEITHTHTPMVAQMR